MKLAREPASSRPKPCASLKKSHESCPFVAPCGPRRKKNDRGQTSAFPSEPSRFAPSILARRGSASPGSSKIELPSAFTESGAYPPDRALPGLRDSAPCLAPRYADRVTALNPTVDFRSSGKKRRKNEKIQTGTGAGMGRRNGSEHEEEGGEERERAQEPTKSW